MALKEVKYKVTLLESERGWGQNFEYHTFDTQEEAQKFYNDINSKNTAVSAPDYYVIATKIETVVYD